MRGILKHTDSTYTSQLRLDVFSYLNLPGFDQAALGISPVILFIFEENEKKDKDKGKEKKRKERKEKTPTTFKIFQSVQQLPQCVYSLLV